MAPGAGSAGGTVSATAMPSGPWRVMQEPLDPQFPKAGGWVVFGPDGSFMLKTERQADAVRDALNRVAARAAPEEER